MKVMVEEVMKTFADLITGGSSDRHRHCDVTQKRLNAENFEIWPKRSV